MEYEVCPAPWGGPDQVLIDGARVPSLAELEHIADEGWQINLLTVYRGSEDLRFLQPIADRIKSLLILSIFVSDITTVEEMRLLESLQIRRTLKVSVDVSRLPRLESVHGGKRQLKGVRSVKSLRDLGIDDVSVIEALPDSLQHLALSLGRRTIRIPRPSRGSALETLAIEGQGEVDVSNLVGLQNLRSLHLSGLSGVAGLGALAELPALKEVVLNGVGRLPTLQSTWPFEVQATHGATEIADGPPWLELAERAIRDGQTLMLVHPALKAPRKVHIGTISDPTGVLPVSWFAREPQARAALIEQAWNDWRSANLAGRTAPVEVWRASDLEDGEPQDPTAAHPRHLEHAAVLVGGRFAVGFFDDADEGFVIAVD